MEATSLVNKAEEKRIKQATETLTYKLNLELIDFKERFLTSYVNYRFAEFDAQIKQIKDIIYDEKQMKYRYTLEMFNKDQAHKIKIIEKQKALTSTNTLKFINEANENYITKFTRLVSELVKHDVRSYPLTIDKITSGSTEHDFNFLITHSTQVKTVQVYARIIFAEGEINAPHYRFIITANKNLKH
jgi:hypothetical protein